jgi:hypothetical protein
MNSLLLLRGAYPETVRLPVLNGIPADAKLEWVDYDRNQRCWVFVFSHPTFWELQPGQAVPWSGPYRPKNADGSFAPLIDYHTVTVPPEIGSVKLEKMHYEDPPAR